MGQVKANLASAVKNDCSDSGHKDRLLSSIESPDWFAADNDLLHWAQLVPSPVRDVWSRLSAESKLVAYLVAETAVSRLDFAIDRNLND